MRNQYLAAFLGGIVALGGAIILFGWIFGIEEFIRPADDLARVKPITALAFVVAGGQLVLAAFRTTKYGRNLTLLLTFAALFQFVVMGSQLLTTLGGTPSSIELLTSAASNEPAFELLFAPASIGTILLLFGIGVTGLIDNFDDKLMLRRFVCKLTLALPVCAFTGYLLRLPILYFYLPPVSTRMAIYSAALGLIAGLSIYFSSPALPRPILKRKETQM